MDRQDLLWDENKNGLREIFLTSYEQMKADFLNPNRKKIIQEEFYASLDKSFRRAINYQKNHPEWILSYVSFTRLLQNTLLGNYGYQIDLMNERLYFDDNAQQGFWCPKFVFDYVHHDFSLAANLVKRHSVRVQEYEILEIQQTFLQPYYMVADFFLTELLPSIIEVDSFHLICKADKIHFITGYYREQPNWLWVYQKDVESV